jgi:hypothetical protein
MLSDTMAMIFDDRRLIVDDSPLIFEISDDRRLIVKKVRKLVAVCTLHVGEQQSTWHTVTKFYKR